MDGGQGGGSGVAYLDLFVNLLVEISASLLAEECAP